MGRVFNDANGNGVDDAEAGIAGVVLGVSGTDIYGKTVNASATTAADGSYIIKNLPISVGDYTIIVSSPPPAFDATTLELSTFSIPKENTTVTRNFGYKPVPNPGTVQGKVCSDANQSSICDIDEAGIAGVAITLSGKNYKNVAVSLSTTSDASGNYSLSVLPSNADGYLLSSATPASHTATTPVSTTVFVEPNVATVNDFGFKFNPPPDPDDDHDGVLDAADICPATALPDGVPTERLLPNHYAQMDTDSAFEVGPQLGNGTYAESTFTVAQTKGCSCQQILDGLPGKRNGQYKFGCPKGIMEQWISSH